MYAGANLYPSSYTAFRLAITAQKVRSMDCAVLPITDWMKETVVSNIDCVEQIVMLR